MQRRWYFCLEQRNPQLRRFVGAWASSSVRRRHGAARSSLYARTDIMTGMMDIGSGNDPTTHGPIGDPTDGRLVRIDGKCVSTGTGTEMIDTGTAMTGTGTAMTGTGTAMTGTIMEGVGDNAPNPPPRHRLINRIAA